MTYVFDHRGRLVGVAFHPITEPAVEPVLVFNEYGKLVGYAYAA